MIIELFCNVTRSMRLAVLTLSMLLGLSMGATQVLAHNKIVVIPMAGENLQALAHIITVAKQNGDFTDPVAALDSITDSSLSKRYLVVIAPGVYQLSATLVIDRYVTVVGSGRHATKLIGSMGSNAKGQSAAVVGGSSDGRELSDLTVVNTGSGSNSYSIGIYISGSDMIISRVNVEVSGDSSNSIGILSVSNRSPMTDIETTATGDFANTGIDVYSNQSISNVRANASGGSTNNYAMRISGDSAEVNNLLAIASGNNSYGLYASGFGPSARVDNSRLVGATKGLYLNGPGMRIISTQVDGGIDDQNSGDTQCLDVYSPALVFDTC